MKQYEIIINDSIRVKSDSNNPLQIQGSINIRLSGGVREMNISIYNLSKLNREKALSKDVNFIKVSLNNSLVFDGEIVNAQNQYINYTDIVTTYFCKTYYSDENKKHSVCVKDATTNDVLNATAAKGGFNLVNLSKNKDMGSYSIVGSVRSIFDRLKQNHDLSVIYKASKSIVVSDKNQPTQVKSYHIPTQDVANGGVAIGLGASNGKVFIRCKMQPSLEVGDKVTIDATDFVKLSGNQYNTLKFESLKDHNGDYVVLTLSHIFNYYGDTAFETQIEALI
jgi:hypothetical protein